MAWPTDERLLRPEQVRALAHPQRIQILRLLREDGPATATHLAQQLGTNSGLTSYHLRKLAAQGFVEEESGRGTGRERWWRSAFFAHRIDPAYFLGDPEMLGVLDTYLQETLTSQAGRAAQWLAAQSTWDPAWVSAATFSERLLRLTASRLRALVADLDRVISSYQENEATGAAGMGAAEAASDAEGAPEQVVVVLQAFPATPTRPSQDRT